MGASAEDQAWDRGQGQRQRPARDAAGEVQVTLNRIDLYSLAHSCLLGLTSGQGEFTVSVPVSGLSAFRAALVSALGDLRALERDADEIAIHGIAVAVDRLELKLWNLGLPMGALESDPEPEPRPRPVTGPQQPQPHQDEAVVASPAKVEIEKDQLANLMRDVLDCLLDENCDTFVISTRGTTTYTYTTAYADGYKKALEDVMHDVRKIVVDTHDSPVVRSVGSSVLGQVMTAIYALLKQ